MSPKRGIIKDDGTTTSGHHHPPPTHHVGHSFEGSSRQETGPPHSVIQNGMLPPPHWSSHHSEYAVPLILGAGGPVRSGPSPHVGGAVPSSPELIGVLHGRMETMDGHPPLLATYSAPPISKRSQVRLVQEQQHKMVGNRHKTLDELVSKGYKGSAEGDQFGRPLLIRKDVEGKWTWESNPRSDDELCAAFYPTNLKEVPDGYEGSEDGDIHGVPLFIRQLEGPGFDRSIGDLWHANPRADRENNDPGFL
ncbi:hypothetical protein T439DRAFT_335067 [Meredithblackwellia eburnea MCA 4105]